MRLCCKPDRCNDLQSQVNRLVWENVKLLNNQGGSEEIIPVVSPPTDVLIMTGEQLEKMIREFAPSCAVYLDDAEYRLPPIPEVELFIWHHAVYEGLWLENEYDCDDFTLVLNAAFAKKPGWRWTPRFDCWYPASFGAHSELLLAGHLNREPAFYLIEGQEPDTSVAVKEAARFFEPRERKPYLVK